MDRSGGRRKRKSRRLRNPAAVNRHHPPSSNRHRPPCRAASPRSRPVRWASSRCAPAAMLHAAACFSCDAGHAFHEPQSRGPLAEPAGGRARRRDAAHAQPSASPLAEPAGGRAAMRRTHSWSAAPLDDAAHAQLECSLRWTMLRANGLPGVHRTWASSRAPPARASRSSPTRSKTSSACCPPASSSSMCARSRRPRTTSP